MKVKECVLCYDFGYRQVYSYGRVERIICDCLAGQRRKEKIKEDIKKLERRSKNRSKNSLFAVTKSKKETKDET